MLVTTAGQLGFPVAGGWVANNDFYAAHADVLEALVRGWVAANGDLNADPVGTLDEYVCPDLADLIDNDMCHVIWDATKSESNADWLAQYQDGAAAATVTDMEEVFKQIGAVDGDTLPIDKYFDTSLFISAMSKCQTPVESWLFFRKRSHDSTWALANTS